MAEDVTQAVFVLLWRKVGGLRKDTVLAAWLFRVTCWACVTANRAEARRRKHERQAAMMPDAAAGVMTRMAVWKRVAPMAYEPSRIAMGTARIASSATELMYGMMNIPITSPGASMLKPGRSG